MLYKSDRQPGGGGGGGPLSGKQMKQQTKEQGERLQAEMHPGRVLPRIFLL